MSYRFRRFWMIVVLLLTPTSSSGADLDIESELARPGVKLVVVDFYAKWCEPCMAAMPKLHELRERYGRHGVRFVMVNVTSEEGACEVPDDLPSDAMFVCDDEDALLGRMNVKRLPTLFLFSWDGYLSIRTDSVYKIEREIQKYFEQMTWKAARPIVNRHRCRKVALTASCPCWARPNVYTLEIPALKGTFRKSPTP